MKKSLQNLKELIFQQFSFRCRRPWKSSNPFLCQKRIYLIFFFFFSNECNFSHKRLKPVVRKTVLSVIRGRGKWASATYFNLWSPIHRRDHISTIFIGNFLFFLVQNLSSTFLTSMAYFYIVQITVSLMQFKNFLYVSSSFFIKITNNLTDLLSSVRLTKACPFFHSARDSISKLLQGSFFFCRDSSHDFAMTIANYKLARGGMSIL